MHSRRQSPDQLSYASQGNGSNGQVTGELFKQRANIDILHVPYKGSAPAVQDLLAGQVQLMFDNLPSVLQLIRSGQLRALAVTTAERDPQLPDTPTIAESGLPGFDTSAWFALLAPKATPEAVRAEIERAAIAASDRAGYPGSLRAAGIDVDSRRLYGASRNALTTRRRCGGPSSAKPASNWNDYI